MKIYPLHRYVVCNHVCPRSRPSSVQRDRRPTPPQGSPASALAGPSIGAVLERRARARRCLDRASTLPRGISCAVGSPTPGRHRIGHFGTPARKSHPQVARSRPVHVLPAGRSTRLHPTEGHAVPRVLRAWLFVSARWRRGPERGSATPPRHSRSIPVGCSTVVLSGLVDCFTRGVQLGPPNFYSVIP